MRDAIVSQARCTIHITCSSICGQERRNSILDRA